MTGWWLASYVALWILVILMIGLQLGTLRELGMQRWGERSRARQREMASENDSDLEIGSPIPDLTLDSANGYGSVHLRQPKNRARTLLMFMTPTCESCQLAVDPLNSLVRAEGDKLNVVVVVSGQETSCRAFVKLFPLNMPVVVDANHVISLSLGVRWSPLGLLFDENGVLTSKGRVSDYDELTVLMQDARPRGAPMAAVF